MKNKKDVDINTIVGTFIGVAIGILIIFGVEYLIISGVYALVCRAVSWLEFSWFHSLVITLVLTVFSAFFKPTGGKK